MEHSDKFIYDMKGYRKSLKAIKKSAKKQAMRKQVSLIGGNFLKPFNRYDQCRFDLFNQKVLRIERALEIPMKLRKIACEMNKDDRADLNDAIEYAKQTQICGIFENTISESEMQPLVNDSESEDDVPNMINDADADSDDDSYHSDNSNFMDFLDTIITKEEKAIRKLNTIKRENAIRKINAIKKIDFDKTPFDGETTTYLPLIEKLRSKLLENPKTSMQGIEYLLSDHPISGNDENKVDLPEKFILLNVPAILTGGTPLQRKDNLELIKASKAFNTELSDMIAGCRTIVQSLLDSDLYGRINDEIYESCFKSGFQNVIVKEHKEKASDVLDVLNNVTIFLKAKMNNNEKFLPFVEALKKLGKMSTRSDVDIMERLYDNEKGRETLPARLLSTIIFCKTHRKTLKEFIEMASAKDRLDFQRDPLLATSTVNKPKVTNEIKEIKSVQKNSEEACCSLANLKCNVCFNFHHTSKQCALLQADGKTMYYCSLCRTAEPDHEVGQCKNKPPSRYPGNATGGRSEHGGRAGQGGRWGKGGRGGRGNQGGRGPKGNFDKTKEATSVNAISVTNTKVNRDFGFLDSSEESGDDNDHECDKFNVNAIANKESLRHFMHSTDFIKTLGSPSSKKVRSLKLKTLRLKGGFTKDKATDSDDEADFPVQARLRHETIENDGSRKCVLSSFYLFPKDVHDNLNSDIIRSIELAVTEANQILFDVKDAGSASITEINAIDRVQNLLKERLDSILRPYQFRFGGTDNRVRNNAWFVYVVFLNKITVTVDDLTRAVIGNEAADKVITDTEAYNKKFRGHKLPQPLQDTKNGNNHKRFFKSLTARQLLPDKVFHLLTREIEEKINREIIHQDFLIYENKDALIKDKTALGISRIKRLRQLFDHIWLTSGLSISGVQIAHHNESGAGYIYKIHVDPLTKSEPIMSTGSTRLFSEATSSEDTEIKRPRTSSANQNLQQIRQTYPSRADEGLLSQPSEDENDDDEEEDEGDESETNTFRNIFTNDSVFHHKGVYKGCQVNGDKPKWVATLLTVDTKPGQPTDLNPIMQAIVQITVQFGTGIFLKPISINCQLINASIGTENNGFYRITVIVTGMVDKSVNVGAWGRLAYPYKGSSVTANGVVYPLNWIAKVWFRRESEFNVSMFTSDFETVYADVTHFSQN